VRLTDEENEIVIGVTKDKQSVALSLSSDDKTVSLIMTPEGAKEIILALAEALEAVHEFTLEQEILH
jgi:predicted ribonuclease YlaK